MRRRRNFLHAGVQSGRLKARLNQEFMMYKKILLAYNGSAAGQKALLDSGELAAWGQASLHLVAVMPLNLNSVVAEGIVYSVQEEALQRQAYQRILDEGLGVLAQHGYQATGELLSGDAITEICNCARRTQADLIVVGHKHKNGWVERWWSGAISKSLIEEAPCSLLISIVS
jgi:nucleotide-binding universal stress UspA family protein